MKKQIKEYLKKVLETGINIQEGDSLIINLPEETSEIEETILELQNDYKIEQIVFIKNNYEKLYNFLKNNPTIEEIYEYTEMLPTINVKKNLKEITFYSLTEHCPYYNKILIELIGEYQLFMNIYHQKNQKFIEQRLQASQTYVPCATNAWAIQNNNSKDDLWNLIFKTIPNIKEFQEIQRKNLEIINFLNKIKINSLHFYTDKGTELNIKLTKYSKWVTAQYENGVFGNFPSYEIFTAPNFLSAEGKLILTKPSYIYGFDKINNAEITFSKGKVINCKSDSEEWANAILYKGNNLYRIGEVALVSQHNPISKLNQSTNNLLLDENAGCHIALGDSFDECIAIPENELYEKGKKHYKFNKSLFHQDLIIGDESICVEANIRGKTKTLIKNGNWQF